MYASKNFTRDTEWILAMKKPGTLGDSYLQKLFLILSDGFQVRRATWEHEDLENARERMAAGIRNGGSPWRSPGGDCKRHWSARKT